MRKLDAQNKPVAGSEMKYPIKQWYPIQITEQLYVDRIDRFAVGGLPWGDNGYTTNLTDGQKIIKEYYKKINKEHYSSDNGSIIGFAVLNVNEKVFRIYIRIYHQTMGCR